MKLNRKTEPLVYKRVAFKTNRRADGQQRSEQAINIAIAIIGAILLTILFVTVG